MEGSTSKYKGLYKNLASAKVIEERQEERREILLENQKRQRSNLHDERRPNILELTNTKKSQRRLERYKHEKHLTFRQKYQYDYSLQLSEWMKEAPSDLDRWYMIPCPKGQRCMVIACNGITESYNKAGKRMFFFHSMLPGDETSRQEITILDCIYAEKLSKFFVLDAIALGNHDLLDCETSFRFYWIKTRFEENLSYGATGNNHRYSFETLNYVDFSDLDCVKSCFMKYPQYVDNCPELDGFIFYHKDSSYTCGITPLVCWLFAFMVPEVLGFDVNEAYMTEKPDDYVDFLHYMTIFDENLMKKQRSKNKGISNMEEDFIENDAIQDCKNLETEDGNIDFDIT